MGAVSTPDETPPSDAPRPRLWRAVGLALLMGLHFGLAADTARRQSVTHDEVAHLPAGVSYYERGTFKMYRLSPPLGRLVPSLALLPLPLPRVYDRSWAQLDPASHWAFAAEWTYAAERGELRWPDGSRVDVAPETARQLYLDAFTRGRLVVAAWSALTLLVAFAWARWWFGAASGWLAAALYAVCPQLIGGASLMTTDLATASTAFVAGYTFARWLDRPTWSRVLVAGVALALAQLVKMTLLWLIPAFAVWGAWALRRHLQTTKAPLLQLAALPLIAILTFDAVYLFEGVGVPLGDMQLVCDMLTRERTATDGGETSQHPVYAEILERRVNRFRGTWLGGLPCPLPRHYVEGWDEQKLEMDGGSLAIPHRKRSYLIYLHGELREGARGQSWWYYYPYALLIRLPLGTWALAALALVLWTVDALRSQPSAESVARGPRILALAWLAVFPVLLVAIVIDATIGVRHVLSAVPFLLLLCASTAADHRPVWLRVLAVGGLLVNAVSVAQVHPHELAYYNALVGGPANGFRQTSDADAGQDLRRLARWLDRHPEWKREVRLAYSGQTFPEWEGIAHRLAPRDLRHVPFGARLPGERLTAPWSYGPQPGKFAVSTHFVIGFPYHTPLPRSLLLGLPAPTLKRVLKPVPYLMIPRGCYQYFGGLEPIVEPEVGYSILLYDVSLEQANALRRELKLPLLPPR